MNTYPQLQRRLLATAASAPFVTYYAAATATAAEERVELSATTFANWVAKTSSLLAEEYDVERGDVVAVDLPPHWLATVFAAAAWNLGAMVWPGYPDEAAPRVAVCGPDGITAAVAGAAPVLACSLHPLATRFTTPLPPQVRDFGVEVWGQPDAFTPYDAPDPGDAATPDLTQAELFAAPATPDPTSQGGRVLTTAHPLTDGLGLFATALREAGSLVLVRGGDAAWHAQLATAERATQA